VRSSILLAVNGFVIALFVLAAAGGMWISYYLKKKRRDELRVFATQMGLEYSATDPFGLVDPSFHLFQLGEGRGCENVVWGAWQGVQVTEADYWYYTESTDSHGVRTKDYHRFSVALLQLENDLFVPTVRITKEGLLSTLGDHLGFRDIDFESEDFNRMFNVRGEDREFAFKLIDARMMEWLQSTGGAFGFETFGRKVLVYCRRLPPGGLVPVFGTAKAFHDHIPKLVWTEYRGWGRGEGSPVPAAPQAGPGSIPPAPPTAAPSETT
jgi:hypothetical protein